MKIGWRSLPTQPKLQTITSGIQSGHTHSHKQDWSHMFPLETALHEGLSYCALSCMCIYLWPWHAHGAWFFEYPFAFDLWTRGSTSHRTCPVADGLRHECMYWHVNIDECKLKNWLYNVQFQIYLINQYTMQSCMLDYIILAAGPSTLTSFLLTFWIFGAVPSQLHSAALWSK